MIEVRQMRALAFTQMFLDVTADMAAQYLTTTLDVTVDATKINVYGKKGHPGRLKRTDDTLMSPEFLAGWHAKQEADRRDAFRYGPKKNKKDEFDFGYDLHLARTASRKGDKTIPRLILAAIINTPGMAPGRVAAQLALPLKDLAAKHGLDCGNYVVDRGYSDQHAHNFHRPIEALGFTPVFSYKIEDLKPKGGYGGMPFVAGSYYCASTPEDLLNAHYDFYTGQIDKPTYQARLERLDQYRMRPKQSPKPGDHSVVLHCPSGGSSPTASCLFKNNGATRGKKVLLQITPKPSTDPPPKVCANSSSISVPLSELPKHYQHIPFGTPEHREWFSAGRNQIEGENRVLKDPALRIDDAKQRRARGYGVTVMSTTTKLVAANIFALTSYLTHGHDQTPKPTRKRSTGRPPKSTFADYALDPTRPAFIPGEPTEKRKPPKAA